MVDELKNLADLGYSTVVLGLLAYFMFQAVRGLPAIALFFAEWTPKFYAIAQGHTQALEKVVESTEKVVAAADSESSWRDSTEIVLRTLSRTSDQQKEQVQLIRANNKTQDPAQAATATATDQVMLGHEYRTAKLLTTPANIPAGNKVQLAGNDKWGSGDAAAKPVEDVLAGRDVILGSSG